MADKKADKKDEKPKASDAKSSSPLDNLDVDAMVGGAKKFASVAGSIATRLFGEAKKIVGEEMKSADKAKPKDKKDDKK